MPLTKGHSALELPTPAGVLPWGCPGPSPPVLQRMLWPASGQPAVKAERDGGVGSVPRFLAASALISVVLKENLMVLVGFFFWQGGW